MSLERQTLDASEISGNVLRYGWFYDPGTSYDPQQGSIPNAIRAGTMPIVGAGAGTYSFIDLRDAAAATMQVLAREASNGIYNIVVDAPVRRIERESQARARLAPGLSFVASGVPGALLERPRAASGRHETLAPDQAPPTRHQRQKAPTFRSPGTFFATAAFLAGAFFATAFRTDFAAFLTGVVTFLVAFFAALLAGFFLAAARAGGLCSASPENIPAIAFFILATMPVFFAVAMSRSSPVSNGSEV